jgi:hypothetical protein
MFAIFSVVSMVMFRHQPSGERRAEPDSIAGTLLRRISGWSADAQLGVGREERSILEANETGSRAQ